jgi:hypothetical protein
MGISRYIPGAWNAICDSCGFEKKNFQLRKRWDGLMVCADTCWETDHPQKYLRVREDNITPPWVRPEPEDTFTHVCYLYARTAYADLAEADCAQADLASPSYAFLVQLKAGT